MLAAPGRVGNPWQRGSAAWAGVQLRPSALSKLPPMSRCSSAAQSDRADGRFSECLIPQVELLHRGERTCLRLKAEDQLGVVGHCRKLLLPHISAFWYVGVGVGAGVSGRGRAHTDRTLCIIAHTQRSLGDDGIILLQSSSKSGTYFCVPMVCDQRPAAPRQHPCRAVPLGVGAMACSC